jgi:uncharacterized membrane protein
MRRVAWALSGIGLGLSGYLTVEHYQGNTGLACPATATISCLKVTTSPESVILGIPVAVLGLSYFLVMVILTSPWAWKSLMIDHVRQAVAMSGVLMVFWLIWVELFRVNAICLWCTGVHVVAIALLATVLLAEAPSRPRGDSHA